MTSVFHGQAASGKSKNGTFQRLRAGKPVRCGVVARPWAEEGARRWGRVLIATETVSRDDRLEPSAGGEGEVGVVVGGGDVDGDGGALDGGAAEDQ